MRFSTAPAALPADPAVLARLPDLMPVADLLMYASDHPHRHGGTVEPLLKVLGEDARQAILSGNASSLYGLCIAGSAVGSGCVAGRHNPITEEVS